MNETSTTGNSNDNSPNAEGRQDAQSAQSANKPQNDDQYTEELTAPPKEQKAERIDTRALKDDAAKREKKQPLISRIVKAIKSEKKSYTELIINSEPLEKRVALLQDGVLEKFEVERTGEAREVGAIFKGRIQNLEAGLKAAFVDIGEDKNAFLHYWDILPAAKDNSIEIVRENKSEKQRKREAEKVTVKDIPKLYPIGSEIVLQITKGQIGSKGPRTTTNIALPGRFLVLMPHTGTLGISRKIEDKKERSRLKGILRDLTLPEGMGIIVRTAGEGKKARYFIRDLHILLKRWEVINQRMESTKKPACLYVEPDIVGRTVRDFLTEEIDRVMVDKKEDYDSIIEEVSKISPRSKSKIHLFKEDIPIFERFNIERQIEQTYMRCVPLPGGGEIVIEETEALISIDVNTGSHKNKNKDGKDFILQVNLEAASEICRQVRLRNIGGLIILDFIDMKAKKDRNAVLARMRREMANDKAKNQILPISTLGIMQMTRQRHSESHSSGIYTDCPYCHGRGTVKSARTMSVEVQRRLISVIRHIRVRDGQDKEIKLRVLLHPTNLDRLRHEDEDLLLEIERSYGALLSFRADPIYHVENFKIIDIETGQEQR
jgi:ribonuclease G